MHGAAPAEITLPLLAGLVSTAIFVTSMVPMLRRALRTRDLHSYSPGQILLSNVGNAVHTVYVLHLPPGPIWLLHGFYVVSALLMLVWYARYEWRPLAREEPHRFAWLRRPTPRHVGGG
jgi:hypothetical protein